MKCDIQGQYKINIRACNMLAKNQINKNKMDNKAKSDNKNIDFMSFIQNDINGHIEWEQPKHSSEPLIILIILRFRVVS